MITTENYPKLAISSGETFQKKEFVNHHNLTSYLETTIKKISDSKVVKIGFTPQKYLITTYQKLWHNSLDLLSLLQQQTLQTSNYVIIIAQNPDELISSVWSCWLGGFIPIPIQFSSTQPQQLNLKIKEACKIDESLVIITNNQINNYLQKKDLLPNSIQVIQLDNQDKKTNVDNCTFHHSKPEDMGALFFTSGTTGKPKLVSFTCETILNRLIENYPLNIDNSNYLYWLPFDHASACLRIVNPNALQKVILSTDAFLQNPLLWLDAISQYGIKQTQMTNFGMALIHQGLQRQNKDNTSYWNIESLQSVGIGAETIIPHIFKTFVNALQPLGLKNNIFFVGYGLTECGTIVGGRASLIKIPNSEQECILLGKPCRGYSIRIVDEVGTIVNEDTIGNVEIIGPATITKYHNQAQKDSDLFTEDGWLKTGDNGFLHEGSLAITGRSKDTIIINAKNYSPQIIEEVVNSSCQINDVIAVAIRHQDSVTDELVIFFSSQNTENIKQYKQINSKLIDAIEEIKMTIVKQLNLNPNYIIPIEQKYIPRTASGKIKRQQLINFFQEGKYSYLLNQIEEKISNRRKEKYLQPQNEIEKKLQTIWSKFLNVKDIGIEENIFALGVTSLLVSQLINAVSDNFQVNLAINSIFENPTIYLFSQYIQNKISQDKQSDKQTESSVIKIKTKGNNTPLYFINSTTVAYDISKYLESEQPLYSLNIFSLINRIHQPFETLTMADFANLLIEDLLDFQPIDSYKLIAFCQDGALALEIAQQLQQMGKQVDSLILIDVLFQKEELKFVDRLKLIYSFGIFYFTFKLNDFFNKKLFNQNKIHNDIKNEPLQEKVTLDKKLYHCYFQQARKYHLKPYNGKIIALLSQEWSYKKQDRLRSISDDKIETITINSPHNLLFERQYIEKFIKVLNLVLNNNSQKECRM